MPTTFVLTDVNSDLTSQATVHNKKALDSASGGTSLDITLGGGASDSAAWYTEPSVPNLTEWPAGDYTLQLDIDAAGADITWELSIRRVDSAGVLQQTLGTSGTQSGTGLKTFTVNVGTPITTNAGDRLVGVLSATRAASHGNQTLTMSVNGTNDKLIGAWSVTNIVEGEGVSAGSSTVTGVAAAIATAAAAAAGVATSAVVGAALWLALASSAGAATANAVPVFPQVVTTNQGGTVAGTNHTINLPAGIESGDLVIVEIHLSSAGTITWPGDWTEFVDVIGALHAAFRHADGTEGGSIAITTSASTETSYIARRISNHDAAQDPEAGTGLTGFSTNPDPPNLSPSWGSRDTLWFAVTGYTLSSAPTAFPASYIFGLHEPAPTLARSVASAQRELTAASENPGTFTIASSTSWRAQTYAVAAVPGITEADGFAAGTATVSGVSGATAQSDGSSAGVGAASGVGAATAIADGSSAGAATVSGVSGATAQADASAAGAASSAVVGASISTAIGSSAGAASDAVVGAAIAQGTGASAGVATVLGDGEDAGGGPNIVEGTGSSAGAATVSGVSGATAGSVAASVGAGVASGVGSTIAQVDAAAAGAASSAVVGASLSTATASAAGAASDAIVGAAIAQTTGVSAGMATVLGDGATGGTPITVTLPTTAGGLNPQQSAVSSKFTVTRN